MRQARKRRKRPARSRITSFSMHIGLSTGVETTISMSGVSVDPELVIERLKQAVELLPTRKQRKAWKRSEPEQPKRSADDRPN